MINNYIAFNLINGRKSWRDNNMRGMLFYSVIAQGAPLARPIIKSRKATGKKYVSLTPGSDLFRGLVGLAQRARRMPNNALKCPTERGQ